MKQTCLLLSPLVILFAASCANQKSGDYDTGDPYGLADYGTPYSPGDPINPVYDTPAVYEDSTAPQVSTPRPAAPRPAARPATRPAPAQPATRVHTVAKGDSLWVLSRKYNVSVDAIKRANSLKSDTIVIGRKLVIPAR